MLSWSHSDKTLLSCVSSSVSGCSYSGMNSLTIFHGILILLSIAIYTAFFFPFVVREFRYKNSESLYYGLLWLERYHLRQIRSIHFRPSQQTLLYHSPTKENLIILPPPISHGIDLLLDITQLPFEEAQTAPSIDVSTTPAKSSLWQLIIQTNLSRPSGSIVQPNSLQCLLINNWTPSCILVFYSNHVIHNALYAPNIIENFIPTNIPGRKGLVFTFDWDVCDFTQSHHLLATARYYEDYELRVFQQILPAVEPWVHKLYLLSPVSHLADQHHFHAFYSEALASQTANPSAFHLHSWRSRGRRYEIFFSFITDVLVAGLFHAWSSWLQTTWSRVYPMAWFWHL